MGTPARIASAGEWPPISALNVPPINVAAACAYSPASSPIVSSRIMSCSEWVFSLRRHHFRPSKSVDISFTRFICLGAMSNIGFGSGRASHAANICVSSPGRVLAAINRGRSNRRHGGGSEDAILRSPVSACGIQVMSFVSQRQMGPSCFQRD